MTCISCDDFARNRVSGSYQAGCIECDARHRSQSPVYFDAEKAGELTDTYKWALKNIAGEGGDWKAVHASVKRFAGLLKGAPF